MITIKSISNFGVIFDGQSMSEEDFNDLMRILENSSKFYHTVRYIKNGQNYITHTRR